MQRKLWCKWLRQTLIAFGWREKQGHRQKVCREHENKDKRRRNIKLSQHFSLNCMSSMFMDVKYKSGGSEDQVIPNHSDVCKNRFVWFSSLVFSTHYLIRVITETLVRASFHNDMNTLPWTGLSAWNFHLIPPCLLQDT